jgi:CRISPR/Cas system type I-B associated protein Csh2 (Cas7 group RAMP superfamily)
MTDYKSDEDGPLREELGTADISTVIRSIRRTVWNVWKECVKPNLESTNRRLEDFTDVRKRMERIVL